MKISYDEKMDRMTVQNDYLNKEDFEKRVLTFGMNRFGQIYSRLANKSLN